MDRGRRGDLGVAGVNKASAVSTPGGKSFRDREEEERQRKQTFGGEIIAPTVQRDTRTLMIDPNLLVGPLYDSTSRQKNIKDQLTDITDKLHQTLGAFDDMIDYEEPEDPLMKMMKTKIHEMDDVEMKSHFAQFVNQYEGMAVEVSNANKERDEMLFQLADWFTTDHVDLNDIKSSLDDSEEDNIKDSYFETVTNFEKLKALQNNIAKATFNGKPTRQLEMTKMALEKEVVCNFKCMKDMSMQTMKLKIVDDAPWKYAAQEIVLMLNNVRTENSAELEGIAKNMKGMVRQLEQQALTIKSLTAELREKKEILTKLTDENGDLNQDVAVLRARYIRYEKDLVTAKTKLTDENGDLNQDVAVLRARYIHYEKDLAAAKTMIKSLNQERIALGREQVSGQEVIIPVGKELSESVSIVLKRLEEPEVDPGQHSSDPAQLRSLLRNFKQALECLKGEYSHAMEDVDELQIELEEKKVYITNMENENEKFMRDLRKLRQERKQSMAAGYAPPSGGDAVHQCEHCKCHVTEEAIEDEEIEDMKHEVEKWKSKCEYFKKALADTELKLSDTYKEISALRQNMDIHENIVKAPKAVKKKRGPEEKKEEPPTKEPKTYQEPRIKPKAKQEIKARYLETKPQEKTSVLPPIEPDVPELVIKQSREMNLYSVGDLQGKLNMLVHEIMEFVSEVGRMLYVEKEDDKKIQSVKAYAFDQSDRPKKPARDMDTIKDEQARQKKSQVIFSGQHAVSKLREAFEMLSNSLELGHEEFEMIYRSFKVSQQRNAIKRHIIKGAMPLTALKEFDKSICAAANKDQTNDLLNAYYKCEFLIGEVVAETFTTYCLRPYKVRSLLSVRVRDGFESGSVEKNTLISYVAGGEMQFQGNKPRSSYWKTSSISSISSVCSESPESEAKLKETMNVLSMQRSKSNLDTTVNMAIGGSMFGTDILTPQRSQTYFSNILEHHQRESTAGGNKQEVKIAKAVVPRKGLIQLTSSDAEDVLGVKGQTRVSVPSVPSDPYSPKGLIRRKSMLKYIEAGQKQLEETEQIKTQEEEMTKSLGEYTIFDLQSTIFEMTDTKPQKKRPFGALSAPKTPLPEVKKPGGRRQAGPSIPPVI